MDILAWYRKAYKKISYWDIQLVKLGVFAFALMLAKLWEPILSLEWYWYAVIFALLYATAAFRMLRK